MTYEITIKFNSTQNISTEDAYNYVSPFMHSLGLDLDDISLSCGPNTEGDVVLKVSKFVSKFCNNLRITSRKGTYSLWETTNDGIMPLMTNTSIYEIATLLCNKYGFNMWKDGNYGN